MQPLKLHRRSHSSLQKTRKELQYEIEYLKAELEKYKTKCKMFASGKLDSYAPVFFPLNC